MSADPHRADLDAAVLAWMREPEWIDDEARFEALALSLFAFQFEHCEPYRRFCEARGRSPSEVGHWWEIPPVPTGAFKEVALRGFPEASEERTFRTSGTSTAARGELHLDTLEIYEASLLPNFKRHVFPEGSGPWRLRVLAPSPEKTPDSSLSHMFGCVVSALGDSGSGFDVAGGELRCSQLIDHLRRAEREQRPVALGGTSFSFVHLIDALEEDLSLPAGSRIVEMGGFKGRSRELARDAFYTSLHERLGVPPERIVNQYGMTELGSQLYDSVLHEPTAPRRKLRPPWVRARVIDPESGGEAPAGNAGTLVFFDLANTGSVLAVQTADLGRRLDDGFEILGREPGAEERGCALAADMLLSGATA